MSIIDYICPICGNTDIHSIGYLNGKPYCRKCISFRGEEAKQKPSYPKIAPIHLDYELSLEQKELSDSLLENYKNGVNTLVNADYYGRGGGVIKKYKDRLSFENPGTFRISLKEAIDGGMSDPRNATLLKMFSMIDIGERAGSGIPGVFSVMEQRVWNGARILSKSFTRANYNYTQADRVCNGK